jgi:NhaA family Na+:H+ antiporter
MNSIELRDDVRPQPKWMLRLGRRLESIGVGVLGGLLLATATVVALLWSNLASGGSYEAWLQTKVGVGFGGFELSKPLILWINDGLMAVFFLLVGLEIKRELLEGTLSSVRRAALPALAAVGGMLVPALVYVAFNAGGAGLRGWAIPAATDIAFALGVLALLGRRVPISLKVFLTAVAVVDDLGAVLIIALFYTSTLAAKYLLFGGFVLLALVVVNRLRIRALWVYGVLGLLLWFFVLKSGVHATVAGVLTALAIPAGWGVDKSGFIHAARGFFQERDHEADGELAPNTWLHHMRALTNMTEPPLERLEHALQPWVLLVIMPVFALANAGVVLGADAAASLTTPVSLGVMLGLLLGKPVGVTLFSLLAVRSGIADLPEGVSWSQLHGAAWLAGIGFTMSLFIGNLAFSDPVLLTQAKMGLLAGSLVAGLVGATLVYKSSRVPDPAAPDTSDSRAGAGDSTGALAHDAA